MQAKQARHIAISEVLTAFGFKPASVRKGGRERWYRSPIRSGDANPSFKVDTQLNLWYDHGVSQGGDVINLVCQLKSVSVSEALHILGNTWPSPSGQKQSTQLELSGDAPAAGFAGEKEKNHSASIVVRTGPLTHPALIQYLERRSIDVEIARRYVKEVHFRPASGIGQFFGVGFPSGCGFDVRSAKCSV